MTKGCRGEEVVGRSAMQGTNGRDLWSARHGSANIGGRMRVWYKKIAGCRGGAWPSTVLVFAWFDLLDAQVK